MGSPRYEVHMTTYCACAMFAHPASPICASAFLGFRRNFTGSPVASDRSPTIEPPKRVAASASRRVIFMVISAHIPIPATFGDRHATTNVDWSASEGAYDTPASVFSVSADA